MLLVIGTGVEVVDVGAIAAATKAARVLSNLESSDTLDDDAPGFVLHGRGAEMSPISADHIRAAEALVLDPDYAGGITPERIITALRDISPKQTAEATELAFAKRLPLWRALAAVLYRAHVAPKRGRTKVAEAA